MYLTGRPSRRAAQRVRQILGVDPVLGSEIAADVEAQDPQRIRILAQMQRQSGACAAPHRCFPRRACNGRCRDRMQRAPRGAPMRHAGDPPDPKGHPEHVIRGFEDRCRGFRVTEGRVTAYVVRHLIPRPRVNPDRRPLRCRPPRARARSRRRRPLRSINRLFAGLRHHHGERPRRHGAPCAQGEHRVGSGKNRSTVRRPEFQVRTSGRHRAVRNGPQTPSAAQSLPVTTVATPGMDASPRRYPHPEFGREDTSSGPWPHGAARED